MTIRESGVVVRGEGDGEDGTVLQIVNDGVTAVNDSSASTGAGGR